MAGAVDVRDDLTGKDAQNLMRAFLALRDLDECRAFLSDLMTIGEITDLALRLKVARLLTRGATYEQVAQETGASTATISRIRRFVEHGSGGYRQVLRRLAEDDEDLGSGFGPVGGDT